MRQLSCTMHVACEVVLETGPAFDTADVVRLMPGIPANGLLGHALALYVK